MNWATEARQRLRRVPFFIRGLVSRKVEEFVASEGRSLVTEADLEAVRSQHLQGAGIGFDKQTPHGDKAAVVSHFTPGEVLRIQEIASQSERFAGHDTPFYNIRLCAAAFGCPNALADVEALGERLREEVEASGLAEWIEKTVAGPLLPHHKFKIAVAGCPNACSEPQIKDFGLIAQVEPALESPEACDLCGDCVSACREKAVTLNGRPPTIDLSRCVRCGVCVRACAPGALGEGRRGWQVLVGGKLGRHPRLATVIAKLADQESALSLLRACLDFLMANAPAPQRLGTAVERKGLASLEQFLAERQRALV